MLGMGGWLVLLTPVEGTCLADVGGGWGGSSASAGFAGHRTWSLAGPSMGTRKGQGGHRKGCSGEEGTRHAVEGLFNDQVSP